ncbi:ABC transporter permease [Cohnella fermenti]|uniref:Sugar ABC transporter permease n=1 Tax=Cohnella fermenti TaxID=2565925 RepID=A0A4V3WDW2_9BACL|nr:ABC transporter permease subunit [Cohnella fermenti]THF73792.1 sugar ABC transporter permease [Cohnella fermenti]
MRGSSFRSVKLPLMLMTLPFFALVVLFNYVPLFGWLMAFQNYFPGTSIVGQEFVGLKQFERILSDDQFLHALRNTLVLSLLGLITSPAPMVLALLLNEVRRLRFRKFVQTVSSFPNFISWIIVYSIFFSFFSVDEGAFNRLLLHLGLIDTPTDVLANSGIAWYFQTLVGMWKGLGWGAIIYLAALSGIDQELYEAARVDGAGRFREARHISLPGMMPTFVVLFILGIGNLLAGGGFEQMFTFMNPMVMDRLENLDTYTYKIGLQGLSFSYATAVGVMKSVVSIVLLLIANGVSKRINGRSIL